MKDNKYDEFFDFVKQIQKTQKKQKQRGLNDYNLANVVRTENAEVGMHSNVIYSLINPDGLHYQDDLFLNLFIEKVLKIDDFGEVLSVNAEESTEKNRRIDFTIKSTNYYIGIEMKINAGDLTNQISDYHKDLLKKAQENNNQNVIIYYLTKEGAKASLDSSNGIEYETISFEKDILTWLNACQKEVRNITNLNEAFENYKNIVKKVLNTYKGKVVTLEDKLLKNMEHFELAHKVSEELRTARPKFIEMCIEEFNSKNEKNLDFERVNSGQAIEIRNGLNKKFTIKIIFNDDFYRIQIFAEKYGEDIDKDEYFSKTILEELKKIVPKLSSNNPKTYDDFDITYGSFKIEEFKEILQKLFALAFKE